MRSVAISLFRLLIPMLEPGCHPAPLLAKLCAATLQPTFARRPLILQPQQILMATLKLNNKRNSATKQTQPRVCLLCALSATANPMPRLPKYLMSTRKPWPFQELCIPDLLLGMILFGHQPAKQEDPFYAARHLMAAASIVMLA